MFAGCHTYHMDNDEILPIIDEMMREKKNIEEVLKFTNKKILKEKDGFSDQDIKIADTIWKKLSARRLNRN